MHPGEWRYTRPNREKDLMRRLASLSIPFYCPIIEKSWRAANRRRRISYLPLFPNYVFLNATEQQRYQSMTTNCISTFVPVGDPLQLQKDLKNLDLLITTGTPLTVEERLAPGQPVRVKSGPFAGCEGTIESRRGSQRRLIVAIKFIDQGVSVDLSDFDVEPI